MPDGGRASGGIGRRRSPVMPRGSRLVARIRSPGQAARRPPGEGGGGLDEVFAVVQDDEHRTLADAGHDAVERLGDRLHALLEQTALPQPQRAEDGLGHLGAVGQQGEFHEVDGGVDVGARLGGQPRLPGASGAGQGDQTGGGDQLPDGGELGLPADQIGEQRGDADTLGPRGGRVVKSRRCRGGSPEGISEGGCGGGVAAQYRHVRGRQFRRRSGAQFLVQETAGLLVGGQRLGRAAQGGQHPDVTGAQALVEGWRAIISGRPWTAPVPVSSGEIGS